eukprot:COSAG01_NODE_5115_length_4474_cov_4.309943_2_plen_92_part_00
MVVLEYTPQKPSGPALGLVGKGIVFDSGGLNLKTSPSYMKGDMGGAAAVLGAFESVVRGCCGAAARGAATGARDVPYTGAGEDNGIDHNKN